MEETRTSNIDQKRRILQEVAHDDSPIYEGECEKEEKPL